MSAILIEQARFFREDSASPRLAGHSSGFRGDLIPLAQRLVIGFGNRPAGQACPSAVFAQPLGPDHVAVVQVADRPQGGGPPTLGFHFLVVAETDYRNFLGDPFWLARKYPAPWDARAALEALECPRAHLPPRTVADVQNVLKRVKAGALKEGEDPEESQLELTSENSESPALLGGVQVLVEGGKLVFERPLPDNEFLRGLWTLLPNSTRARLWPASFAFANTLRFDVLVVPRIHPEDFEGYLSEEQAVDYPAGHYELTLQTAAESGNQRDLDQLLNRRSTRETVKLAWALLFVVAFLSIASVMLDWFAPVPVAKGPPSDLPLRASAVAGMAGVKDPLTAWALKLHGDSLFLPRK